MNYVWSALLILSVTSATLCGKLPETMTAALNGAKDSVTVLFSFAGIMCFWSGILKICEKSGASAKCEKFLSPIIRRLFPKTSAKPEITLNIVSNLFGLGNAATPSGVAAMEKMDSENGENPNPSHEMSRFAVLNTAGLQLIPTTVIGILASLGDSNPYSIIPFIWVSSSISLLCALSAEALLFRLEGRKKK